MRIEIIRQEFLDKQTTGLFKLIDDDNCLVKEWHSLELGWKDNQVEVSCIPEGSYKAKKHDSPKFGESLWLQNVPNRSEILAHKGNYYTDILGCILIGKNLVDINSDGYKDVTSSGDSIKELMSLLNDIDEIEIEIK